MLYTGILTVHIVAGFTALVSGGFSFAATKGKKLHTATGKLYTISMLVVGLTALTMCLLRYNPFLFTIGIFSTYMTLTGYRSLQYHRNHPQPKLSADWLLLVITLLGAGGFTAHMLLKEGLHLQGRQMVLLVFMGILFLMLLSDVRLLSRLRSFGKKNLLRRHIGRMGGAYISTFTAFLVTNVQSKPVYLAWLLPTLIGSPFIVYFIIRYTIKKKNTPQAHKA